MNKLTFLSIALFALAGLGSQGGLAHAQDLTPTATKTRAQVIAELKAARDSGELAALHGEVGIDGYGGGTALPLFFAPTSAGIASASADAPLPRLSAQAGVVLTRAEVMAELRRARASGELLTLWPESGVHGLAVLPIGAAQRELIIAGK